MAENEIRKVALSLLEREGWFRTRLPFTDRERYVTALATEMQDAAESQLQHFRESLHVAFVGRERVEGDE